MHVAGYYYQRTERSNSVRHWAKLEGKSPTMADDLFRSEIAQIKEERDRGQRAIDATELMLAAFHAWWYYRAS